MELEKMQKVNEILQLCFEINDFEARQQCLTEKKPTVFMHFYGHTTELEISIFQTGWYPYATKDIKFKFYLDKPFYETKYNMEECIAYLKLLKEVSRYERLQQAI